MDALQHSVIASHPVLLEALPGGALTLDEGRVRTGAAHRGRHGPVRGRHNTGARFRFELTEGRHHLAAAVYADGGDSYMGQVTRADGAHHDLRCNGCKAWGG